MNKQKEKLKVLVLGGNGFIGSQVVEKLLGRAEVIVGTRKETKRKGMTTVHMQSMLNIDDWKSMLQGFDVVVNSVGILRARQNESYEQVHNLAVKSLAQTCALLNISLIHVSAIGLSDKAKSRFIQSKFAGEQAISASGAKATIVRPSLLDGEGGYGAKWFRRVAAWPVQFVMKSGGLVAPLQVSDLGEAIAKLVLIPTDQRPALVELGGDDIYSIPEYLVSLRKVKKQAPTLQIVMPKFTVRIASHIFDIFAWTPLSFGHYELMQGYNVPSKNLLPELLGRKPSGLGEVEENIENENVLVA
ncbi:MAG: NAD(P)H-binding protein [Methylophilaceae bacterium]